MYAALGAWASKCGLVASNHLLACLLATPETPPPKHINIAILGQGIATDDKDDTEVVHYRLPYVSVYSHFGKLPIRRTTGAPFQHLRTVSVGRRTNIYLRHLGHLQQHTELTLSVLLPRTASHRSKVIDLCSDGHYKVGRGDRFSDGPANLSSR